MNYHPASLQASVAQPAMVIFCNLLSVQLAMVTLCNLLTLQLFLSFLFLLPSADSVSFQITRFDADRNDILYEGGARPDVGAVEFNSLSYMCQVGHVKYAEKVPLWNSETRQLSDFTTHFSFIIDTRNKNTTKSAAGLAFFLAPVGFHIPPNSAGGFLGLFNTTTSDSSQNQIVLVEFDTFPNPEWDPEVEHVGINTNSISSANYTFWNASLHSGDTAEAWINYNATTKNLIVSWSYSKTSSTSRENSSISLQVDLMEILPEWVTIGFSAATSYLTERHRLLTWAFNSALVLKESDRKYKKKIEVVVSTVVPVLGVLTCGVLIALGIWWRQRQKRMSGETTATVNLTSISNDLERGAGPRRFTYDNLVSATNNFSYERKLGEGRFGAVYKGYLHGTEMAVAVKKISKGSKQGKKEYITEVKIISQLRHRNLVQLIGWCHDKGEFLLVYEFMPNGSLDSHLFGQIKSPLTWALRYKVVLGLASALLYLHEEWEQCVIHRDIKPSNIMLDSSFNVKLGDFGLARLTDHELGPQSASGLAGTLGYMAPEYIRTGKASKESDVYSFGVVVLEIATGRKSVDLVEQRSHTDIIEWVWNLYGNGSLLSAVDERLEVFEVEQVKCLMIVGLWCAHPDCNLRPSMRQAIQVLQFEAAMPDLPMKMPVPIYNLPKHSVSSSEPLLSDSSIAVDR